MEEESRNEMGDCVGSQYHSVRSMRGKYWARMCCGDWHQESDATDSLDHVGAGTFLESNNGLGRE